MSNKNATVISVSGSDCVDALAPVIAYWSGDRKAESRACKMAAEHEVQLLPLDTRVPYSLSERVNRSRINFEVTSGCAPELDAATAERARRVLASGRDIVAVSSDYQGGIAPAVSTFLSMAGDGDRVKLVA